MIDGLSILVGLFRETQLAEAGLGIDESDMEIDIVLQILRSIGCCPGCLLLWSDGGCRVNGWCIRARDNNKE